ncbi:thymidylate synthetase [Pectobacterium phage POP12]|nr:thymidylate synthetase [Pectobacterium phage POP12]
MKQLHSIIHHVLQNGVESDDRTGVGTLRVFGMQKRWDLSKGFPVPTTKKMFFVPCKHELQWFLSGSTNVEVLREMTWGEGSTKKTIWDDNYNNQAIALGYENGELGPVYGKQWRDFGGVDQIFEVVNQIRNSPNSRRIVCSAWNPTELDKMALMPCHVLWQVVVIDGKVSLQWYQRSVDVFLG